MNTTMPDVLDVDWEANDHEKAKEMINFGISLDNARSAVTEQFVKNYNAYHGEYTQKELDDLTMVNGRTSKTPFKAMKLGKVKLDRIIGEAIELNFQAEVSTINRDAILRKASVIAKAKGRSLMKPFIEQVKGQGHDIYAGMDIPDFGDQKAWDPKNFRTNNERIMDVLLRRKLSDPESDYLYSMLFMGAVFTSEIHSLVVDRGAKNYFPQPIPSEQMIFMDTGLDNQTGRTPIVGHKEKMTFGDVVKRFDISPYGKEYESLKTHFSTGSAINDGLVGSYSWVYFFQWRAYRTKWFKVTGSPESPDIENISEQYNTDEAYRATMNKEKEEGKHDLRHVIMEYIYQGASAGGVVFLGFAEVENQVKMRDYKNRYNVQYDYTTTLIKTIGNKRTAYASVMLELNSEYDFVWWLIKKNMKKLKSVPIYVDKAALGGKTLSQLTYEIEEDDIIMIDSSSESLDIDDARKVVGSLNAQNNAAQIVQSLLVIAGNLEHAMDLLTGINDARQGIEKATTTATTNQSNLKASRSVTYDLFYFAQKHEEIAMTKVLNKEKLAIALSPEDYQFLDEFSGAFVKATEDIALDDYMARVTDGKREHDLKNDIDAYLPGDVNAGKITSADVLDFKIASSFGEAVQILRDATARTEQVQSQMQESKNKAMLDNTEKQVQSNDRIREDSQAHEMEKTVYVEQNKLRMKGMDMQTKLISDQNKNITSVYESALKAKEAKKSNQKSK